MERPKGRPVRVMFLDRAGWHIAGALRVPKTIKLLFLPSYSPELNSVEPLWDHLRENYFGNRIFHSLKEGENLLCKALRHLMTHPDEVRSMTHFDWLRNALCLTYNQHETRHWISKERSMKRAALWMTTLLAAAMLPCRMTSSAGAKPVGIYVATDGADGNPGTEAEPFATLERARDAIRAVRKKDGLPPGGVTVWLRGGVYYLGSTFELTEEDSGAESSPIVYGACGKEKVWLSGGRRIDASHFRPVTDPAVLKRVGEEARGELVQLDIEAEGITDYLRELPDKLDYKAWEHHNLAGSFEGNAPILEVFCNGERMPLARWPNKGFALHGEIIEGSRDFKKGRGLPKVAKFLYEGDRPSRWRVEDGVWLRGYWGRGYRFESMRVERIDTAKRQIDLVVPPFYGLGTWGGKRFLAYNLLDELDAPGEWHLDRKQGILYLRPPEALEKCDITISMLKGYMVSMRGTSHVTIRGLSMECSRQNAVGMEKGSHNRVIGCEIRNIGGNAVDVMGGTDHGVIGCDIHHIGGRAVTLQGGDRQTLVPCNHVALNNHIHHTSLMWRTHAGAITLQGVGCRAAHNLIHHDPHVALWYWGNDHLVEYNEIYWVLTETNESGAMYTYANWTFRGNILRHNYIHHVKGQIEGSNVKNRVLHLDGCVAGTTFTGNVCYRVWEGVDINGGPSNIVENNLFIDTGRGVQINDGGVSAWTYKRLENGEVVGTRNSDGIRCARLRRLKEVPYNKPPYTKYPRLADMLERDPIGAPWHCVVSRNVFVGGLHLLSGHGVKKEWTTVEDNWDEGDPGFVDLKRGDFRLRKDSPVWKLGFKPIPFDKIGLYEDETRASWPVSPEGPPEGWKPRWMVLKEQEEQMVSGELLVFRVKRAGGKIEVDGVVGTGEWTPVQITGATMPTHDPAHLQWGTDGKKVQYPSVAWIEVDDNHLYVAFVNEVDPAKGVTNGQRWGADDAVEIALAVVENERAGPIMVLQGYTNGHFDSSGAGGAPRRVVDRVGQGVEYAAKVAAPGKWTAEWKVPFSSLGIDPRKRNPRLLFNLSARKPASKIWAMWMNAPGAYTFDVRKGGLLWLTPFGNVAFSSYALSMAVIDVDGRADGVVMKPAAACQPYGARWAKPEGIYLRGEGAELTTDAWEDFEIAFIPEKDGVVSLYLRGRPYASRARTRKLLPVWGYFDDVEVEGAELQNGGFEEMGANGLPAGWRCYTPSHSDILPLLVKDERSACSGRHCAKVWYSGGLWQKLRVTKGTRVTVRARVRGEVQE